MAVLFTDDRFLEHDTGEHPESVERLKTVGRHLKQLGLSNRFARGVVEPASSEQLALAHDPAHIAAVERFAKLGGGRIEPDTEVCERSFEVARLAAGAAVNAVDQVLTGGHSQAVCLIRPPGHHARPTSAMGFCLFNNVAVAAMHAQQTHGLSRILIVDWDVHHGNGTQEMFFESDTVYFFSVHRHPFYPGTGAVDETGSGPGLGTIFNLPLEFGISRADYKRAFADLLETAATRCRPELILLSAGFDAHAADPIGSLGLESEDFKALTRMVLDVADQHSGGRLVSLLEGGYNVDALAESVACHLETLLEHESNQPDS